MKLNKEKIQEKSLNRVDWYSKIGYEKSVEDILVSLSAFRIILYNKTGNHNKYRESTEQIFELAAKISKDYCE